MSDYHSTVRHDVFPLIPKSERLLDVGGGTGTTAKALKHLGKASSICVWDKVAPQDDPEIDFSSTEDLNDQASIDRFFSQCGEVDTILFLDVLEHLIDPWATVQHFSKFVKPGGTIVASIPNVRHFSASFPLIFRDRWEYKDEGILDRTHLRFFVRESATSLMALDGFEVESVTESPIGSRLQKLINASTFGLFRSFLTLQYFIVVRKSA